MGFSRRLVDFLFRVNSRVSAQSQLDHRIHLSCEEIVDLDHEKCLRGGNATLAGYLGHNASLYLGPAFGDGADFTDSDRSDRICLNKCVVPPSALDLCGRTSEEDEVGCALHQVTSGGLSNYRGAAIVMLHTSENRRWNLNSSDLNESRLVLNEGGWWQLRDHSERFNWTQERDGG